MDLKLGLLIIFKIAIFVTILTKLMQTNLEVEVLSLLDGEVEASTFTLLQVSLNRRDYAF